MIWAHSDRSGLIWDAPGSAWQPLAVHLQNVSRLSRLLAVAAAPEYRHFHDLADRCGLLHDFGKYTECFQEMITTGKGRCPHAIHGAAIAWNALSSPHIAAAIAGHHAGIPDLGVCKDKITKAWADAESLKDRAMEDSAAISTLLHERAPSIEKIGPNKFDLLTRMLLSCLVDADRLDTAGRSVLQTPLNAAHRLQILLDHIGQLGQQQGTVNAARREVLSDCLRAASFPEQILSLSVPTGGGKTLSAMAFALQRAALLPERYRRIIVVIPYLSIIEQNAEVYKKIFGANSVLEHHSGSFLKLRSDAENQHFLIQTDESETYEKLSQRAETENWDAPLIVTTSVRFFESLFSNHPSDVRRIHNIARSIVILDEVQVLPRSLLAPLLGMIEELAEDWGCSFVLSTATKPAFERPLVHESGDRRWAAGKVREIVQAPADLHRRLQRVTIDWRIKQPVDWPEVAGWMLENQQALCVVNVREHASALYQELARRTEARNTLFHLSTRMCPAHRLKVIAEIRQRLSTDRPCLVVSTQLIEAGVDLDFPIAFRALGPLDSIVQVAGRADREGKLTATLGSPGGRLVVFKPINHRTPPNEYKNATDLTESLARTQNIQPSDLDAMTRFFDDYYTSADTGSKFVDMRAQCQFKTLAQQFEMISSRTQDVYVPFGEGKKLIDALHRVGQLTPDLRRALHRFTVGLYPWELLNAKMAIYRLRPDSEVWVAADTAYNSEVGLQLEGSESEKFLI